MVQVKDHKANSVFDALGVSDDDWRKVARYMAEQTEKFEKESQVLQAVFNSEFLSDNEKVLAIYNHGRFRGAKEEKIKLLAKIIKAFGFEGKLMDKLPEDVEE